VIYEVMIEAGFKALYLLANAIVYLSHTLMERSDEKRIRIPNQLFLDHPCKIDDVQLLDEREQR